MYISVHGITEEARQSNVRQPPHASDEDAMRLDRVDKPDLLCTRGLKDGLPARKYVSLVPPNAASSITFQSKT